MTFTITLDPSQVLALRTCLEITASTIGHSLHNRELAGTARVGAHILASQIQAISKKLSEAVAPAPSLPEAPA